MFDFGVVKYILLNTKYFITFLGVWRISCILSSRRRYVDLYGKKMFQTYLYH